MRKQLLGVNIDDVTLSQAVKVVEGWLTKKAKHYIVTPNPEIIVIAQKDQVLKEALNKADLSIPDGRGLKLSGDIVCNTTGVDLMEELIKLSSEKAFTAGFLGGKDGVAERASERLKKRFPKLKVTYVRSDINIDKNGQEILGTQVSEKPDPNITKDISISCDILFVGFGPPKQEKWIANNLSKIDVKVAMVVGGSMDYFSGDLPRAPKLLREIGLEWLFRLIIQPWRIKRQLSLLKYIWLLTRRT